VVGTDKSTEKELDKETIQAFFRFTTTVKDPQLLATVLSALGDSARIRQNRDLVGGLKFVPPIVEIFKEKLQAKDLKCVRMCLRLLGNLCFDHPYNREEILNAGGVPCIVECLKLEDEEVMRIGAGCVANICSNTENICELIYSLGGVDQLLLLLKSTNDNVQCMTSRALRNICETEQIQNYVYSKGTMEYCINICNEAEDDDGMVVEFLGLINSLVASKTIFSDFLNKFEGIKFLLGLLIKATEANLIADIQHFLDSITENEATRVTFENYLPLLKSTYLNKNLKVEVRTCAGKTYSDISQSDKFLSLFYNDLDDYLIWINDEEKEIQLVAAKLIGSVARDEKNCLDMVKRGVATILIGIVQNEERDLRVRHYCTGTLRNLAIDPTNKKIIFQGGIMGPAINLLKNPNLNQVVVYQAIGLLKNLINGGEEYINSFVELGGIKNMVDLTSFDETEHIKFESSRVVVLLFKTASVQQALLDAGGLHALKNLLASKFDLLHVEALAAAEALLNNGKQQSLGDPEVLKGFLTAAFPSEAPAGEQKPPNCSGAIVSFLVKFVEKGGLEALGKVVTENQWKNFSNPDNSEDAIKLSTVLEPTKNK